MIQIHLCIIYLCAGLSKLRGARWWDGTAVWTTMNYQEYAPVDMSWLAYGGDGLCHLVSTAGVLLTHFVEISFAFLIWDRRWRLVLLVLALLLHASISLFTGMGAFQAVMVIGGLSFIAPDTIRRCVARWQRQGQATTPAPLSPSPAAQASGGRPARRQRAA